MRNWRKHLQTVADTLTEPSWWDLLFVFGLIYALIMRVDAGHNDGWASSFAIWATSLVLAFYGATLSMTVLILIGRGLRTVGAVLRGYRETA